VTTPWSFDAETATAAAPPGGELPADLQVTGRLWPYPGDLVADHSSEGNPGKPATRSIPLDPPQGPLWAASHDGPTMPAPRPENQAAPASGVHDGHQGKAAVPLVNFGRPWTVEVRRFLRHLATDTWDSTGKRVSPPDAPSAPVQIYGSEHDTRPRMTPAKIGPLFSWAWPAGDQWSINPGYLGVNAAEPNMAPRMQGAVSAQPATLPYVAPAIGPAEDLPTDYDLGF
jgi:hypothetical protein